MPEASGLSSDIRKAALFRNGRNQALRIPKAFELPGTEVLMHREGEKLVIEPIRKKGGLLAVLAGWGPLEEEFPDIDERALPLDEIDI